MFHADDVQTGQGSPDGPAESPGGGSSAILVEAVGFPFGLSAPFAKIMFCEGCSAGSRMKRFRRPWRSH